MIGCHCEVCQSQDSKDKRLRTSVLIRHKKESLVIDCGPDFRQQMLRTRCNDLKHVLFTHEHRDHVAGLDELRSINYLYNRKINTFMSKRVEKALRCDFRYIFNPGDYKGGPKINTHSIQAFQPFTLIGLPIIPLAAMHGKMPVLGYRIGSIAYLTDVSYIPPESLEHLKGVELLILDALQKPKHHSHFSLTEAIEAANTIKAKQSYFTHIGHFMGKHKEVEAILPPTMQLAYDGLILNIAQ